VLTVLRKLAVLKVSRLLPLNVNVKVTLSPTAIPLLGLPPPSKLLPVLAPMSNWPYGAPLTLSAARSKFHVPLEVVKLAPVIPPGLFNTKAVIYPPFAAGLVFSRVIVSVAEVEVFAT
jgi:hypothetical protein